MLHPTVDYTFSEAHRKEAFRIHGLKDHELNRLRKSELLALIEGLGQGTDSVTSKEDAIATLRDRVHVIRATSQKEANAAYKDPTYQRAAFFDQVQGARKAAEAAYAKGLARAANPLEFGWSAASTMIEASARLKVTGLMLRYEGTDMDLAAVKAELTQELLRRVSFGTSRSTNQVSNLLDEAEASALAELLGRSYF